MGVITNFKTSFHHQQKENLNIFLYNLNLSQSFLVEIPSGTPEKLIFSCALDFMVFVLLI